MPFINVSIDSWVWKVLVGASIKESMLVGVFSKYWENVREISLTPLPHTPHCLSFVRGTGMLLYLLHQTTFTTLSPGSGLSGNKVITSNHDCTTTIKYSNCKKYFRICLRWLETSHFNLISSGPAPGRRVSSGRPIKRKQRNQFIFPFDKMIAGIVFWRVCQCSASLCWCKKGNCKKQVFTWSKVQEAMTCSN